MKNSMFSKVFARHILSVFLVVSTTLTVGNLAAAANANDQSSKGSLHQKSASAADDDNDGATLWERNLQIDRFDGARLVQAQFVPARACYTFAGPVCGMMVAVPQGSPCNCPNPWDWRYTLPGQAW